MVLAGGTQAWAEAGLPLETGATHMASEADDVVLSARERGQGREEAMREYLAWEINLVNDMASDDDQRFQVAATESRVPAMTLAVKERRRLARRSARFPRPAPACRRSRRPRRARRRRVAQQDAAPYGGEARIAEPGDVAAIVAETHVEQPLLDRFRIAQPFRRGVGLVDGHSCVERAGAVHAGEIDQFAAAIDDRGGKSQVARRRRGQHRLDDRTRLVEPHCLPRSPPSGGIPLQHTTRLTAR